MSEEVQNYPQKIYPSKRDTWIVAILGAIIIFCTAGAIYVTYQPLSILAMLFQELLYVGAVAFTVSILRSTYYTLKDDELLVRSGPFRWTIALEEIVSVTPSRTLLSGAALSLDRLIIQHGDSRHGTIISPEDKELFLRDLASRSSKLQFESDRVIRVED